MPDLERQHEVLANPASLEARGRNCWNVLDLLGTSPTYDKTPRESDIKMHCIEFEDWMRPLDVWSYIYFIALALN